MSSQDKQNKIIRKLRGFVVSDKMDKTVVVSVDRTKKHSKYKKRYVSSKKYKIHDPENECRVDDYVEFAACRPYSKDKRWKLVNIIEKAPVVEELPEVESEKKHKEREQERLEKLAEEKQKAEQETPEDRAKEEFDEDNSDSDETKKQEDK